MRSAGCSVCSATATRLRLLRVLQTERLNVTELTAVLGVAQSGVSRHLGLLEGCGPGRPSSATAASPTTPRRAGFGAGRSGPVGAPAGPLRERRRRRGGAGRRGAARRGAAAAQGELRRARRRRQRGPPAGAGPQLAGLGARARASAAAAGRRRPRLRRRVSDGGNGALGPARDRRRSLARSCSRARGRWPSAGTSATSRGSAASSTRCPSATPASTSPSSRRRCTTPRTPARAVAEAVRVLRPGGRLLVLDLRAARPGVGARSRSAIAGWASTTKRSPRC